ncbi:peptide/nickel ABC transporter extracellular binding protein [Caldibacillus thermoamylovorans]|uniref:Peptide/nickel ABC transporter extracellular binding protein n=2 Tax=Caldibacillus thermoamylovorans TaxID=35841 RepID=A0A090IUD8_9BACI|nr:peptide ABC transporter substrate-binding protein [Caldibacillus thermoamylovorans]CEE01691.1 peptide/nickel ABC transporter extracellular binding protein [Caldibacillus thermoamylovorans]
MRLKRLFMLLSIGFIITFLAACTSGGEENSPGTKQDKASSEKSVNFVNKENIPTMDPALATDESSFAFLRSTMGGLYRLNLDGKLVPELATDHEVSADGLTWTFKIRENAKWENGDPITANDFVYAWRRAIDPATGSEYGPYLMNNVIKNATAISNGEMSPDQLGVLAEDDFTLVVELENPTPYFENLTSFGTLFPLNQKFVEAQGDKFATSSDTLLASGPYKLTNWTSTSDSWELVKNDNYWDADTVQMDKIHFDVVKDPQTAANLYEEGSVDRVNLTSDLVDQYSGNDDFVTIPNTFVYFIKFNQKANDALANKNIRAAISRAFDKEAIVDEILNDGSIAANGLVPTGFVSMPESREDFRKVSGDLVTFDKTKAQEYWKKGLSEIGKDKVELELLSDDDEATKSIVEYVANQLETNLPGLTVTIKQVPKEQRLDLEDAGDYQMEVARWGPDFEDPYTFMSLFTTDSGNNKMGYSNAEYDQLILETSTTLATDNEARFNNFVKAEKILFDDAAIAPIYQNARAELVNPKLKGVPNKPVVSAYEFKWLDIKE